ncbi:hypothetical protein EWM64_g2687 [Hericium alpestre]|uniref:F-box domain-containing protein n=1 Tax=Hericium alpestre TaxID=135208 RepID=A0A4Z0A4I7_9AGAM|nr:hypothetical protein EWM64_g2687 [Hericium alpestre]
MPEYDPPQVQNINDLPPETLLHIFSELNPRDIYRCSVICKRWNDMIEGDMRLQEIINASVMGLSHGMPDYLPLYRKDQALLRYFDAWTFLDWTNDTSEARVGDPDSSCTVLFRGHMLARKFEGDRNIYIYRVRTCTRLRPAFDWVVKPNIDCDSFTMDPLQFILVLMRTTETTPTTADLEVHFRDIFKGDHLSTRTPMASVTITTLQQHNIKCEGQVAGRHVGVLWYDENHRYNWDMTSVVVWNWYTGDKVLHIIGRDIYSFCFLDELRVLVASTRFTGDGSTAMLVYDLMEHTSDRTYMPREELFVRNDPSRIPSPLRLFSPRDECLDSIVTICAYSHPNEEDDGADDVIKIFVPASKLRARLASWAPGASMPWDTWGVPDTHVRTTAGLPESEQRYDTVVGMHALELVPPEQDQQTPLRVFDFDHRRLLLFEKGYPEENVEQYDATVRITRSSHVGPAWNGTEFTTYLPLVESSVAISPKLWFLERLVDDEALIFFNLDKPDRIEHIKIMCGFRRFPPEILEHTRQQLGPETYALHFGPRS